MVMCFSKQQTAYDLRCRNYSSDVFSSVLPRPAALVPDHPRPRHDDERLLVEMPVHLAPRGGDVADELGGGGRAYLLGDEHLEIARPHGGAGGRVNSA